MSATRKNTDLPITAGRALSHARVQRFLRILIDRNFTWSPAVKRLRAHISAATKALKYLAVLR